LSQSKDGNMPADRADNSIVPPPDDHSLWIPDPATYGLSESERLLWEAESLSSAWAAQDGFVGDYEAEAASTADSWPTTRCECGVDAAGAGGEHSGWCPLAGS
jgi:hypothetical protein